jgi:protein-glucosylgalactosylhydroxylysine glucosidase
MSAEVRRNDFDYAMGLIERSRQEPNSMGLSPVSIAAATLGDAKTAGAWFQRNLTTHVLKPPFNVRTETATNNTGYFLTASGGLLQNIIYGFTGLRIKDDGLIEAYAPVLPPPWKSLTLRRVAFRGKLYDIAITRDAHGKARLTRTLRTTP